MGYPACRGFTLANNNQVCYLYTGDSGDWSQSGHWAGQWGNLDQSQNQLTDVARSDGGRGGHCFKKENINYMGPSGKFSGFAYAGLGPCVNRANENLPVARQYPDSPAHDNARICFERCRDMGSKCAGFQLEGSSCLLNACREDAVALGTSFNNRWGVGDSHHQTSALSGVSSSAGGAQYQCYYKVGLTTSSYCGAVTNPPTAPRGFTYVGIGDCIDSTRASLPTRRRFNYPANLCGDKCAAIGYPVTA